MTPFPPAPDLTSRDVIDAYDELPLWSAMFGLLLLEHVPLRRAITALDVGCGTGFPLIELAQRLGPESSVHGIDPWEAALSRAERKLRTLGVKNVVIRQGDAAALPYDDASFDLVVSNLGLNNFADPAAAMRECRRVMKGDGTLAFTTNLVGHMREFYEHFAAVLRERVDGAALERLDGHIHGRATVEKIEQLLEHADLKTARLVQDEQQMRFANGTALFNHAFIRLGFVDGWLGVVGAADQDAVFAALEARLNNQAEVDGALVLTIPRAYIEARARG
jgi:arsenite methyltransferase